jgi:hypothetical protein
MSFKKVQRWKGTGGEGDKEAERNPRNTIHTVELKRSSFLKFRPHTEHPPGLSNNPNPKKFLQKIKNAVTFQSSYSLVRLPGD